MTSRSILPVALLVTFLLAGCSGGGTSSQAGGTDNSSQPAACAAAIKAVEEANTVAGTAATAFSNNLTANAAGPASGFAVIGTLAKSSADSDRTAAAAYDALATVTTSSYAAKVHAAATALRADSDALDAFATAATAYAATDSPATTQALNTAAQGAVDAPAAGAAAIADATSVYKAAGGNVCQ